MSEEPLLPQNDREHVFNSADDRNEMEVDTLPFEELEISRGPYGMADVLNGEITRLREVRPEYEHYALPESVFLGQPVISNTIAGSMPSGMNGNIVELRNPDSETKGYFVGVVFDDKKEQFIRWLAMPQFEALDKA